MTEKSQNPLQTATQSEFADLLGVHKSHITRLKQAGRLVLTDKGLVDVVASQLRIKETEGGRDDLTARHAAQRGQDAPKQDETRASAQARKEMAQADVAEMERDVMRGKLVDRTEVEKALADVVAFARAGVENLPHRVAAQLVGKDFEAIVATLRQEVIGLMGEMHREAGARLADLVKVEG